MGLLKKRKKKQKLAPPASQERRSNNSDGNRLTYDETLVQAAKNVTQHNYFPQVQIHRQVSQHTAKKGQLAVLILTSAVTFGRDCSHLNAKQALDTLVSLYLQQTERMRLIKCMRSIKPNIQMKKQHRNSNLPL